MIPIIQIVNPEKRKAFNSNILNADVTIRPSIMKITTPIFTDIAFDINWANKSVPPVLTSYRSMLPTPIPINPPPINTLGKIERENWFLKGASQSMNIDATIKPRKLL